MKRVMAVLVVLCHAALFVSVVSVANNDVNGIGSGQARKLHVLLMTSSSQQFNSSGAETAVRLALDHVNADASILLGYELQLAGVKDTKVYVLTAVHVTEYTDSRHNIARCCIVAN